MKTRINTIKLENFKGVTTTLELNGNGAHITGWHGTGKSRFLDAIIWVITGHDLKGRSNYEDIKDNTGAVGLRPVRATLEIDNGTSTMAFTRGVDEKTITANGETILNGHEGYYAVDGTKVTAKVFGEQLTQHIGDIETWVQLADIDAITSLTPERMRNAIISIIGDVTTADVLARHPNLKPAAELIAKHGLNDTKKALESKRAALPAQIADIKTRINETETALERHEQVDTTDLEAAVSATETAVQDAQTALSQAKMGDTTGIREELEKIERLIDHARAAQQKERNARWERNSASAQGKLDTAIAKQAEAAEAANKAREALRAARIAAATVETVPTAPAIAQKVVAAEAAHQQLRERWAEAKNTPIDVTATELTTREQEIAAAAGALAAAVNAEYEITDAIANALAKLGAVIEKARYGSTLEEAQAQAEAHKAKLIAGIEQELKDSAQALEQLKNNLEIAEQTDAEQAAEANKANEAVAELESKAEELTRIEDAARAEADAARVELGNITVEPEDPNEWAHLATEARELREQLANPGDQAAINAATDNLDTARATHKAALEALTTARASNKEHAAITARITELKAHLTNIEAVRDNLTAQLELIQEFARARIAILTEKAAKTFEYISVELERLTFQGTLEEVCTIRDPAGVRYTATNPGNQALMNLDIIKAARKQTGVHPPLLVDALESRRTIDPALEGEQVIATEATGTRKAPTALKIAIVK